MKKQKKWASFGGQTTNLKRGPRGNGLREVLGRRAGMLRFAEAMGPGREDRDQDVDQDPYTPLLLHGLGWHPGHYPEVPGTQRDLELSPGPSPQHKNYGGV